MRGKIEDKKKYSYSLQIKCGSTGVFFSTVCYCWLSLSPLLFVCTPCSRGQPGKWAYWNSVYPRGGHPGVLLPAQLLLQEDDRERASGRTTSLTWSSSPRPSPPASSTARTPRGASERTLLLVHFGWRRFFQSCWCLKVPTFDEFLGARKMLSPGTTTGTPSTTRQHPSTAICSNRFKPPSI